MNHSRALFAGLAALALGVADASRSIELSGMDRSVSPTADFYDFCNGAWYADAKIPGDRSAVGTFTDLGERNQDLLHDLVEAAAKDAPAAPRNDRDKVGLFYRVGMDEARAEQLGIDPVKQEIAQVDGIRDRTALIDEIAALHRMGVRVAFGAGAAPDDKDSSKTIFALRQGGLGLPNRQIYVGDSDRAASQRTQYEHTVSKMLQLTGEVGTDADVDAHKIVQLETALAKASNSPVQMRDPAANYHLMTEAQVAKAVPGLDWKRFFRDLGRDDPGPINLAQPGFFTELNSAILTFPIDTWRAYLRYHLVAAAAPYLSKEFVDASFQLTGGLRGVTEQPPRWKRVLAATNSALGMALGKMFVEKTFPPEAKKQAHDLVVNLKSVLRERIEQLDWMGPDTKKQALIKLDAMGIKVGYPDHWRDYSKLIVADDSYVQNVFRANEFEFDRMMARLGKPVDRSEFTMTPQTVNASYSPSRNEIQFPAGILQPPFFDPKAPPAQNYGAIGAVIGHEMTHGFDDQGRQFDAKGNLRDWWTADDAKRFKEKAEALASQYDGYVAVDDLHVDGHLTLGENIADNGGVRIAFIAYKKATAGKPQPDVDGFTPDQQFFISFAQLWRQKSRPQAMRNQIETDPHSPPRFRVIGVMANQPEFWQAFGSQPPAPPIRIW